MHYIFLKLLDDTVFYSFTEAAEFG